MARDEARGLRDAVRRLMVAHGVMDEARRPCGAPVSLPQAHALLELLAATEPLTVSELADRLPLDRSNVSRLCDRMAEQGELARAPHPRDGRARALVLTQQGQRVARSVDASSAEHFARLAAALGDDVPRVVDALTLLTRAMERLDHSDEEPS